MRFKSNSPVGALLAAVLAASAWASAASAQSGQLPGMWVEIGGQGAARIDACPRATNALCATGLAPRAGGRGERVEIGLVLVDLVPAGANRWKGTYIDGRRRFPATLRMIDASTVEMKVCVLIMCQTARYRRAA